MSSDEKTNVQSGDKSVIEDFQPPSDWDRKKESDTLILMLPGTYSLFYKNLITF